MDLLPFIWLCSNMCGRCCALDVEKPEMCQSAVSVSGPARGAMGGQPAVMFGFQTLRDSTPIRHQSCKDHQR